MGYNFVSWEDFTYYWWKLCATVQSQLMVGFVTSYGHKHHKLFNLMVQLLQLMVLIFLGAHFIWAFSLMFLFSGRGYWQELIESIVWAHNKLKLAPAIQPRALSITQGRAVGLAHYLLGGIGTTWSFFLARIISVG